MLSGTGGPRARIKHRGTHPVAAVGMVKRIYTKLAVIEVTPEALPVIEMIPGMRLENCRP